MKINKNYQNLVTNFLFSSISQKVNAYKEQNPTKDIIRLGIGDVTGPLAPVIIEALQKAVAEMAVKESFRGYGAEQGYAFLRDAICGYYAQKGVALSNDEVIVSDGAKSDTSNILDIFDKDNVALIPDPVYPVYLDTNIMVGREIVYMEGNEDNGFLPMPDDAVKADIIYLCSPNNPTGAVYSKGQLEEWVNYAIKHDAVILFDAAYEAFIRDETKPTSIFEVPGAFECAIEFGSLSKTAGFTGTRCAYTIVPKALEREGVSLNKMWLRRQSTKFNGVPYIVQRGAEALYTPQGLALSKMQIDQYLENAQTIIQTMTKLDIWHTGGANSPYIWLKCPNGMGSWEFFDYLLDKTGVVGTPGAGFGAKGEGYFRLSAFGNREDVIEAMRRFESL